MRRHLPTVLFAERLRRPVAVVCAAMVLALTLLSASPTAHRWLHAATTHTCGERHADPPAAPAGADDCAVVLFASGVSLPVAPLAVTPPADMPAGELGVAGARIFLVAPRFLRQPERGPPASSVS